MTLHSVTEPAAWARACVARLKASQLARQGLNVVFVVLVLVGPRSWRDSCWRRWHRRLHWNATPPDRPPGGPGWLDRKILERALRKLKTATVARQTDDDVLLVLQVIMHCGYVFDTGWYPDFRDPALLCKHEVLDYLFTFPIFVESADQQDRIVTFVQRIYADLDRLHSSSLDPEIRAEFARYLTHYSNFMPAVFADVSLRPLARTAGRWLETHLRLGGHRLDHEFTPRSPGARLRVGVLVRDMVPRNESFLALPFGLGLQRDRFEVVLITGSAPPNSGFGVLVEQTFERIVVVTAAHLDERVEALRALDLDFLILANASAVGRISDLTKLCAHRLARWQVLPVAIWPTTTGLATTNIALTATNTEPPGEAQRHYSETVCWLDGTFHCFAFGPNDPRLAPPPELPPELSPAKPIMFASGAVFMKLGPALRQSFIAILQQVPESELLLYPFNPNWQLGPKILALRGLLLEEFAKAGIARARVRILPAMTPAEILQMLRGVTVYLDSFPFAGGASLIEPIFAACPVVTLKGRNQRGLLGAGVMRALGMDELVAEDAVDYQAKAIGIARSPEHRRALSARLRQAVIGAPFLDPIEFGRRVGKTLEATSMNRCDSVHGIVAQSPGQVAGSA